MERISLAHLLAFAASALGGLVPAASPFYRRAQLVDDPSLTGTYAPPRPVSSGAAEPAAESLFIARTGPARYRLTFVHEDGRTVLDGRLFRAAGGARFLDLTPAALDRPALSAFRFPRAARHLGLRIEGGGSELRLTEVDPRSTLAAARARRLSVAVVEDPERDPNYDEGGFFADPAFVVSAPTTRLQELLVAVSSAAAGVTLYRQRR